MGKNILLLTGSPRKGGNSDLLVDAFSKGAREAGHSVSKFETANYRIGFCHACNACWSKGTPCSFDDDFNQKLYPLLTRAEALVLCFPLYFCSFPAQLKVALDKFYSIGPFTSHPLSNIREAALLTCAANPDPVLFEGVIHNYRHLLGYEGWVDRGMVVVPGTMQKGEVEKTDGLERANRLGREF